MMIEVAGLIAALAFAVLAGYAVFTLMQARRTFIELRKTLVILNSELSPLLQDLRTVTQNINTLTNETRDEIQASGLLQIVGAVGQTVEQVHGLVSRQGLLSKLGGLAVGIKAAAAVVKERFTKSAAHTNGDDPR